MPAHQSVTDRPEAKICAAAHAAHIDLSGYELVATEHSRRGGGGVALARERRVAALMKAVCTRTNSWKRSFASPGCERHDA